MEVALYGATGNSGSRILKELLSRGHRVTAIVRNPARLAHAGPAVPVKQDDLSQESRISMEDYAAALVDELEQPKHPRQRFSVGY